MNNNFGFEADPKELKTTIAMKNISKVSLIHNLQGHGKDI